MKKEIFNYENKKVVNYSGEVEVDKKDKTIVETLFKLVFVALGVAVILALLKVVTPEGAVAIVAISMGVCVGLPLLYLAIKYFVVRKEPMNKNSYHIKKVDNGITGESDVEITDYTEEDNEEE